MLGEYVWCGFEGVVLGGVKVGFPFAEVRRAARPTKVDLPLTAFDYR